MVAAGRCGVSESEFWAMTPRYFYALTQADRQRRREAMERARLQAYWIIYPHVNAKENNLKPTDLGLFDWEQDVLEERAAAERAKKEMLKNAWAEMLEKAKAAKAQ